MRYLYSCALFTPRPARTLTRTTYASLRSHMSSFILYVNIEGAVGQRRPNVGAMHGAVRGAARSCAIAAP